MSAQSLRNTVRSRALYLWISSASIPLGITLHHFFGLEPVFKGQPVLVVWSALTLLLVLSAWFVFVSTDAFFPAARICLAFAVIAALIQGVISIIRFDGVAYYWLLLPSVVVLLLLKPPSKEDSWIALQIFFVGMVLCSFLVFGLWFFSLDGGAFDTERFGVMHWTILENFGTQSRWGGPFGNPNYAGPIGALTFIFALNDRGKIRVLLIAGGVLITLLSQSRGAVIALLTGLTVYVVLHRRRQRFSWAQTVLVVAALSVLAAIVSRSIVSGTVLGNRPLIWMDFLEIWSRDWILGSGTQGIEAFFSSAATRSTLPVADAHNSILDTGARFGVLVVLPTAISLVLAWMLITHASHREKIFASSMLTTMLMNGLSVALYSWTDFPTQITPFVLLVVLVGVANSPEGNLDTSLGSGR